MPKPVTRWRGLPTPERRLFPSPPVAQQTPHVQHVNIFPFRRVFFLFLSVEFLHSQWPRLFFFSLFFYRFQFFFVGAQVDALHSICLQRKKKKSDVVEWLLIFLFSLFLALSRRCGYTFLCFVCASVAFARINQDDVDISRNGAQCVSSPRRIISAEFFKIDVQANVCQCV